MDERHPRKQRTFSKISLVSSTPTYPGLELRGAISRLRGETLQCGEAVKISLGGSQGRSNFFHSTASYLTSGGKYLFLDPNYGIFEYSNWVENGVVKSIAYLYRDVYCWVEANRNVPITNYNLQIETFTMAGS
jgi:hypothetical protein